MKIGIDARMYGPKIGGAGVGRYVEEVILQLQKQDNENEFIVFLKRENIKDCPIPNKRWKKVLADYKWYGIKEQLLMPRIIDAQNLDLIHFPHFNVPIRTKTPYIVTIHDLIMLDQSWSDCATTRGPLLYRVKHAAMNYIFKKILKNAKKIITISEHAKFDLIHKLNTSPNKVKVVYNGVDSSKKTTKIANKKIDEKLLQINKPFLLNVGNAYPHKNLSTLLHAFSFFVKEHPEANLVLVGPEDKFRARLKTEAEEIEIPKQNIHFTGFVTNQELTWLYKNAAFYIIPSKKEGFGMPPLEALMQGTPVAASNASCIPEILGKSAIYFKPNDIESMMEAMETLLTNKNAKIRTLTASNELIKKYTWENHAKALLDIYKTTIK